MGSVSVQPTWWTEKHGSQWDNLKDALKRDWEQTKQDLHLGGTELHQSVGDTLHQAAGASEPIPASNAAGTKHGTDKGTELGWDDAEAPLKYGFGARHQYGAQHATWNDKLESTLKTDWEAADGGARRGWADIKDVVRHGYDRARNS